MLNYRQGVSTHSRPKAAGNLTKEMLEPKIVSTHSRPKAAGSDDLSLSWVIDCFNTQPPEGGWKVFVFTRCTTSSFNTQPPEGGWRQIQQRAARIDVSTHSRPKAAGLN